MTAPASDAVSRKAPGGAHATAHERIDCAMYSALLAFGVGRVQAAQEAGSTARHRATLLRLAKRLERRQDVQRAIAAAAEIRTDAFVRAMDTVRPLVERSQSDE
jgi:hypothetical protein